MAYYFPRPAARRSVLAALLALEEDNTHSWRPFYSAYDVHSRMLDPDGCATTMSIGTCRKVLNWLANTSAVEKYSRGAGRARATGYRLSGVEIVRATASVLSDTA